MPDKNLKSYMLLIDSLDSLANGAKIHGTATGYPADITEENILAIKKELEDSREKFVQSATESGQLKENYEKNEKEITEKVSRYKTTLYGHFGKKNIQVQDFGLKPYKERNTKKNKNGEMKTKSA